MFKHEDTRRTLIEWASGDFKIAKAVTAKTDCVVGDHYHRNKDEHFLLLSGVAAWIRSLGWAKPTLTPAAFILVFLALAACVRAPGNVKTAWRDLLKGDARKFDLECEARYALIHESKTDEVTLPPLSVKPVSLFFNDLKPDPTDWRNTGMAQFYRKKAIHLSK